MNGEASAATKQLVDAGPAIVSMVGYSLVYNTLDNNRNPTKGLLAELRQDFAGIGGDVNFIRTTGDVRWYYELISDIISVFRLQGGYVTGWGDKQLRMLDHFQMGPNLVRGFQTAGIGPRDMTIGTSNDALGGTMYWGTSFETQVRRFSACRRTSACASRSSPMPALSGTTPASASSRPPPPRSRRSIRSPAWIRTA